MHKQSITLLFFILSISGFAQEIAPMASFQKDSIAIGEEVPYSLWIRYPKHLDVIFPDSLYDFSPFEINKRKYFTTRSDSTQSLDSVVYFLSTYEIDSVQHLQLPVYLIDEYDSVELRPSLDSIILKHVVSVIPDSVAVIVNTDYQKVPLAFNYPYFTAALVILAIAGLVIFLAFGGRIKKMLQVYWLTRRHNRFVKAFSEILETTDLEVERVTAKWKIYLEKLENAPYSKFTTKEIVAYTDNDDLKDQLAIIDRYIYTVKDKPDTHEPFRYLLKFAEERFQQKINQVKHG